MNCSVMYCCTLTYHCTVKCRVEIVSMVQCCSTLCRLYLIKIVFHIFLGVGGGFFGGQIFFFNGRDDILHMGDFTQGGE